MVVTYCTSGDVADLLRVDISPTTLPNIAQVEKVINRMENYIDQRTGHTYGRTKVITRENHSLPLLYTFGWGAPIFLQHREIRVSGANETKFDSAAGDKIETYNGSTGTYTDITDTNDQYNILPEFGEVYLRGYVFTILRDNRIRITYRYGSTTVPSDISDACIKLTCIDLLRGSLKMDQFPMGANGLKPQDIIREWKEDADRVIRNREEVYVVP